MPSISSDSVNYLIWRYFREEGLSLSGYALDEETHASKLDSQLAKQVGEGDLVKLVLKGMQLVEIETAAGSPTSVSELKPAEIRALQEAGPRNGEGVLLANDTPQEVKEPSEEAKEAKEVVKEPTKEVKEVKQHTEEVREAQETREAKEPTEKVGEEMDVDAAFKVSGLERVDWKTPEGNPIIGGVDSVFNSPLALVVAGVDSTVAYVTKANDSCDTHVLECLDTPTCVEPLGVDILGPDQCVLVGYASGCVRQWRFNSKSAVLQSVLHPKAGGAGPVLLVRSSPSGTRAVAADTRSGIVNVWDLSQRRLVYQLEDPTTTAAAAAANGSAAVVGDLVWMGCDTTVAVAYASGISIYRLPEVAVGSSSMATTLAPTTWLRGGHAGFVSVLAFEQVMQLLATGGDDGRVCVWNAQSTEPVRQTMAGSIASPVSHVSWLGIHLLTATTDGSVRLWDARAQPLALIAAVDVGEPVYSLQVSKHTPTHIAVLTPSGAKVYVLNQSADKAEFAYVGGVNAEGVQCLAWSADPTLAVSTRSETVVVRCAI